MDRRRVRKAESAKEWDGQEVSPAPARTWRRPGAASYRAGRIIGHQHVSRRRSAGIRYDASIPQVMMWVDDGQVWLEDRFVVHREFTA